MNFFFSSHGRIPRHKWWIGSVCVAGAVILASVLLWSRYGEGVILGQGGRTAAFAVNLVFLYVAYCLGAKRFRDRNKSPAHMGLPIAVALVKLVLDLFHVTGDPWVPNALDTLFLVVQVGIGVWLIIELGCLRGTVGDNDYGPDPLDGRTA